MESENRLGSGTEEIDYSEVVERSLKRAHELRDDNVRTLGRLVRVLRDKKELTRAQLGSRTHLHPQWLMMLEQELLIENDLSKVRLNRLGRALGSSGTLLAKASGIEYTQLPERARPIRPGVKITR